MRYYLWRDGKESGPHAEAEVRQAISDGTIVPQTLARSESESEWKPLQQILPSKPKTTLPAPEVKKTALSSPGHNGITRTQGALIVALLCIGLGLPFFGILKPVPRWEYKKMTFLTEGDHDRTGLGAMSYSSIKLDDSRLDTMGAEGWELVTSYLEMETAFPNFGKGEYVTGLQPNIRPQSLVLIFKRAK